MKPRQDVEGVRVPEQTRTFHQADAQRDDCETSPEEWGVSGAFRHRMVRTGDARPTVTTVSRIHGMAPPDVPGVRDEGIWPDMGAGAAQGG